MKRLTIFPPSKRKGSHGAASRSQALLEFALALPILLMLLFGIIDLAALFQAWLTVENIARQTVRYAVTGQYDPTFCQRSRRWEMPGLKCDYTDRAGCRPFALRAGICEPTDGGLIPYPRRRAV